MAAMNINHQKYQELLQADKPLLVDFWAPWCSYCRRIGPAYDKVADQHSDDLSVVKVNIDEEPELANEYQIMSIPSLMVMVDGKIVNRSVGAKPKAQILEML